MHSHSALVVYTGRCRRSGAIDSLGRPWRECQFNWKVTVEIVKWLVQAVIMMGFVALVLVALAGLFMIVFSIAAGIDRRINQ